MTIETPVRRLPRTAPAAPLAGRQPVEILFAVFACAWAVQALESKSDRLRLATLGSVDGLSDLLVVGSALAVVWRPSMLRFGVLAFVSILNFWIEIPEVSNHLYAITLINVGFLLQASIRTFRDRRGGADHGPAVSEDFGATVRLITIGLYVMAAF